MNRRVKCFGAAIAVSVASGALIASLGLVCFFMVMPALEVAAKCEAVDGGFAAMRLVAALLHGDARRWLDAGAPLACRVAGQAGTVGDLRSVRAGGPHLVYVVGAAWSAAAVSFHWAYSLATTQSRRA
jgi:hypothetical protein